MNSIHGIFDRTERLIGREGMQAMASVRVVLFGVGGVGSWCAEGLVRSGIQHLTIVDSDVVCASNINRQLMATTQTIGRPKVDVLKKRLLEISPDAEIDARHEIFCEATASSFHLDDYDYIVDAIDSVADKALLINMATRTKAVLVSSMGAALKMDPTRISVAEFWKVEGCPLARALRKRFKKEGTIPKKKFQCVLARIAGPNYRLVAPLVRSGTALYAAHLPLDAHPTLGNNAGLARAIGLGGLGPFAEWRGFTIGVKGSFPEPIPLAELHRRVREACPGGRFETVDAGPALVRTVGVVSGGAAEDFSQAVAEGLDAYVTGEIGLADYNAVRNDPIDFVAAGHYATERFGPRAVAGWLAERFGVEAEFVDFGLKY